MRTDLIPWGVPERVSIPGEDRPNTLAGAGKKYLVRTDQIPSGPESSKSEEFGRGVRSILVVGVGLCLEG